MRPAVVPFVAAVIALAMPVAAQVQPSLGRPKVAKTERPPLQLKLPTRAAVGPAGELLVTDYKLRRVCTVASDGRKILTSFTVLGLPTAIGATDGRLFVGIEDSRRVEIYTPAGQLQGTLGGAGFEVGDPRDLVIDQAAELLYVVDGLALEVKVFDISTPEGTLVGTIGQAGTSSASFQNPTGIALDPVTQQLFVSDFGPMNAGAKPRVLVFGTDGAYQYYISGDGGPTGQYFGRPQGLLISASGHLLVVDSWRGEVVIMDRVTKMSVGTLGSYGKKKGQMRLPLDAVILGPDLDLWVTSTANSRVERYAAGGQL